MWPRLAGGTLWEPVLLVTVLPSWLGEALRVAAEGLVLELLPACLVTAPELRVAAWLLLLVVVAGLRTAEVVFLEGVVVVVVVDLVVVVVLRVTDDERGWVEVVEDELRVAVVLL